MKKSIFTTYLLLVSIMGLCNAYGSTSSQCTGLIANFSNCNETTAGINCGPTNYNSSNNSQSTLQITYGNGWGFTNPNPQTINFSNNSDKQCILTCGSGGEWVFIPNNQVQCAFTSSIP